MCRFHFCLTGSHRPSRPTDRVALDGPVAHTPELNGVQDCPCVISCAPASSTQPTNPCYMTKQPQAMTEIYESLFHNFWAPEAPMTSKYCSNMKFGPLQKFQFFLFNFIFSALDEYKQETVTIYLYKKYLNTIEVLTRSWQWSIWIRPNTWVY